jgi:hypothetical protein
VQRETSPKAARSNYFKEAWIAGGRDPGPDIRRRAPADDKGFFCARTFGDGISDQPTPSTYMACFGDTAPAGTIPGCASALTITIRHSCGQPPPQAEILRYSAMRAVLTTLGQGACFGTTADVWNFYAKRSGQIDLMFLFLDKDLSNLLRHRVLSKNFTLADAIAVVANGFIFVIEIISEHVFRIFRCAYRLWSYGGHFAEVIDLPREDKGMIELLLSVDFKLGGNVHVLGAAEHLGIEMA